ncbi:MAG: hypothetical protein GXP62_13685 [Oligoflexia bacterium]|nr:hypothetical protein [Oligoflexia bacterium]
MIPFFCLFSLLACQAATPPPAATFAPEASMTPVADTVLVQLDIQASRGAPTSVRVLADGQWQERSETALSLGDDLRVKATAQPASWRTMATVDTAALDRLRTALQAPDLANLQPLYQPEDPVSDPTTLVWTLNPDGHPRTVVVKGVPFVKVPALDQLHVLLNALRAPPAPSSTWRVGDVERIAHCDANAVPVLRPILQALFDPNLASKPDTTGSGTSSGTSTGTGEVVLDIRYRNGGIETTRCRLVEDGLFTCTRDGVEVPDRKLTGAGVAGVRAAIRDSGFADSSGDLCP